MQHRYAQKGPGGFAFSGTDNPALGLLGAEHRTPARAICRAPRHLARDSGRQPMLAQVTISADGDVTVTCDNDTEADDETTRLAGLVMDDLVARAVTAAYDGWFKVHYGPSSDDDVVRGD